MMAFGQRLLCMALALASSAGAFAQQQEAEEEIPAEALREFSQVYGLIRKNYVDKVNDDVLLRNAIHGMVSSLDSYSAYIDKEQLESFSNSLQGNFGGVGVFIDVDRNIIRIVSPIDNTPAQRAGLEANDYVVSIDDLTTEGMSIQDAANLMRGVPGTEVTLSIVRLSDEGREDFDVVLEREVIKSPSVSSALADETHGFLRINQFLRPDRTPREVAQAIDELVEESNGKLEGLVIDLRSNPGGDLTSSLCVASIFLEQGKVIVANRGRTVNQEYKSDLQHCHKPESIALSRKLDLVVLVNKGSASASEILAGALQDNDRGVIIGTSTFGKASVQQIFNLEATDYNSAVKLTSAHYYTPSGKSIHEIGIQPDVVIEFVPPDESEENDEGQQESIATAELSNLKEVSRKEDRILPTDNQFIRALEILRGMKSS